LYSIRALKKNIILAVDVSLILTSSVNIYIISLSKILRMTYEQPYNLVHSKWMAGIFFGFFFLRSFFYCDIDCSKREGALN
jgi:hypothetical protein